MNLYTCILEFQGGSYLSQNYANDELEALDNWTGDIANEKIILEAHEPEDINDLILSMTEKDNSLVALEETDNVWFSSCLIQNELALLHIINTKVE